MARGARSGPLIGRAIRAQESPDSQGNYEHTDSWEREGETHYRRILDASEIAPRLTKGQQVTVTRAQRKASSEADVWAAPEA